MCSVQCVQSHKNNTNRRKETPKIADVPRNRYQCIFFVFESSWAIFKLAQYKHCAISSEVEVCRYLFLPRRARSLRSLSSSQFSTFSCSLWLLETKKTAHSPFMQQPISHRYTNWCCVELSGGKNWISSDWSNSTWRKNKKLKKTTATNCLWKIFEQ